MKVFSSNCTFDYSWNEVSTANWRKYCPWNDKSTHVVGVDTLSRSVDPSTGIVSRPGFWGHFRVTPIDIAAEHSCVRNAWSHVISPCHNGYYHCSGGALHLMSTRFPMSTQSRRKSQCVPPILLGPMFSTFKKLWYTDLHHQRRTPPISIKKPKLLRFVVAGRR